MVGFAFERMVMTSDMKILRIPGFLRIENRTVGHTLLVLFGIMVADGVISQFLVTGGYGS
jgi:hypothetical protein